MGEQNLPRFKAESGTGELMRGSFCEGAIGETVVGRQLPALHGDGLVKLQGDADELVQVAVITSQFAFELAVGEVEYSQADKFHLEFLDLFERETAMELAPDGAGYRLNMRFARFINVTELMQMFCQVSGAYRMI